jgi:NAD-dependent dihydropyrimidine dehydrogenase PreA subunit
MNDNEREMDLALAEAEQENRLLRARNERLERELAGQVALNKMAENARELGLDYEPAVQEKCFLCGERVDSCASDVCPKSAQPAVQEGRDWSLLEATQESLREHMAEIKRLKAAQPAPVQHDECVVCGDKVRVIPRPWVGLTDVEMHECAGEYPWTPTGLKCARAIEAKLKEKNT